MAIRKKTTEEAKKFWALAEKTAKEVESWPAWKRGYLLRANGSPAQTRVTEDTQSQQTSQSSAEPETQPGG